MGQGAAGEVECVPVAIEDHLHDVGIVELRSIGHRVGGRDHGEVGILHQGGGQGIDEGWIDERFVALDVDDVGYLRTAPDCLRDAIGSGGMLRRSHRHLRPELKSCVANALVVGGHQEEVEFLAGAHPFEDVMQKRLPGELV